MDYSLHRLARMEHEQMVRSLPRIPEYGDPIVERKPRPRRLPMQRLRLLGFPLKRKTTVRDRPGEIVEALRRDLADPDLTDVLCCGGLGPTPDDRTFAAVATALGRELVIWEETRARIERRKSHR